MHINTPPLGWNTWNTFGGDINEALIRETADALISTGLAKAGYQYVVIDDTWSERERDANGRLVPDHNKFPNGIKTVADYVHSKGLKFGIYSCAGTLTCAGYPGSFDHEYIDAQTFAEWGVDFLKYDFCYHTPVLEAKIFYRRMGAALANCGRDILFSACCWGVQETWWWIKTTGAHMWRSTADIQNGWQSVKMITKLQPEKFPFHGRGCFNDMDMLVVGMNSGSFIEGKDGSCNMEEYRSHFSIWCMLASPLMIGCDVRKISDEALSILTNREALAINQDPSCNQVYPITLDGAPDDMLAYARLLDNGDFAIALFNLSDMEYRFTFGLEELGIPTNCGKNPVIRDVWIGKEQGLRCRTLDETVEGRGCRLYRCMLK